jgi:hypothetical protein
MAWWHLVGLLGCVDGGLSPAGGRDARDTDGDTDFVGETDTDLDVETDSPSVKWPDPFGSLDVDHCQQAENYDPNVASATTYYVGEFTLDDNGVAGTETWVLYANDTWAQTLGAPKCEAVWEMSGAKAAPVSCDICDFSVEFSATLSSSNCPPGVTSGKESFNVQYDVWLMGSGVAKVYFAESGNELGAWHWNDDGFSYVTDPACELL